VRPLPGATVSMPLRWEEVDDGLDPKAFTIRTALTQIERYAADPVAAVLEDKPSLAEVLDQLASNLLQSS
jgi:bifunctional non-homologous end joining protein LigD